MRRLAWMLAFVLLLAACAEGSGEGESTTTTSTTTTTIAQPVITTTQPALAQPEVESLAGRSRVWEPGVTYEATDFLVPLRFEVTSDGWLTSGSWDRVVAPIYTGGGTGELQAALSFLAFMPDAEPDEIIDAILATEGSQGPDIVRGIEVTTDRSQTTVAGYSATTIDVYGGPEGRDPDRAGEPRCNVKIVDIAGDEAGWPLVVVSRGRGYGVGACHSARVWVVQVGDRAITIIGSTRDDNRFDELMPILEGFLANSVTFGEADG